MSVGIMDADIATYTLVPFNLECMKLASYYKNHNQFVILAPSFLPERHQTFFYRKDYEDGIYPLGLASTPNVQYGGLAFSNNKYVPLPIEIEKMKPDASLYSKMEKYIKGTAKRDRIWQNMREGEHIRLSLDGETIWPEYTRQLINLRGARLLMLHDYDLGKIKGSFEEVKRLMARARTDGWATRLGMKFPVQVETGQDLLNWSSFLTNQIFYSLQYNGVIDDDAFIEWVGKCRERAIFSQVIYNVTPARYDENDFLERLLPKIFRQVIISRSYRVFFSLNYSKEFFTDPKWCDVLQLFNYYMMSYSEEPSSKYFMKIANDTMFDFAKNTTNSPRKRYGDKCFTKDEIRNIFAFVKEKNPSLFEDFYTCSAKKLGGRLDG